MVVLLVGQVVPEVVALSRAAMNIVALDGTFDGGVRGLAVLNHSADRVRSLTTLAGLGKWNDVGLFSLEDDCLHRFASGYRPGNTSVSN